MKMRTAKLVGVFVFLCANLVYAQKATPKSMSSADALTLDAAVTHINLIAAQVAAQKREIDLQAANATKPYYETVRAVCARYGIDPNHLGNEVVVDVKTGTITRTPPTPPPSPPTPAKK